MVNFVSRAVPFPHPWGVFNVRHIDLEKNGYKKMDVSWGTPKPINKSNQRGLGVPSHPGNISESFCHSGSDRKTVGKHDKVPACHDGHTWREIPCIHVR